MWRTQNCVPRSSQRSPVCSRAATNHPPARPPRAAIGRFAPTSERAEVKAAEVARRLARRPRTPCVNSVLPRARTRGSPPSAAAGGGVGWGRARPRGACSPGGGEREEVEDEDRVGCFPEAAAPLANGRAGSRLGRRNPRGSEAAAGPCASLFTKSGSSGGRRLGWDGVAGPPGGGDRCEVRVWGGNSKKRGDLVPGRKLEVLEFMDELPGRGGLKEKGWGVEVQLRQRSGSPPWREQGSPTAKEVLPLFTGSDRTWKECWGHLGRMKLEPRVFMVGGQ